MKKSYHIGFRLVWYGFSYEQLNCIEYELEVLEYNFLWSEAVKLFKVQLF